MGVIESTSYAAVSARDFFMGETTGQVEMPAEVDDISKFVPANELKNCSWGLGRVCDILGNTPPPRPAGGVVLNLMLHLWVFALCVCSSDKARLL